MTFDYSFHPLTWPDRASWRKQRRLTVITFIGLPLLISLGLWAFTLLPPAPSPPPNIFDNLVINIWGLQIFLSLWLSVVVTQRATPGIAHLRETSTWPLVKIMPYSLSALFRHKAASVEQGLRWPIRLVLLLRVASIVLWVFNTPDVSLGECVLAAAFIYIFCAELIVSVRYNCAVGLLASTFSRTTAQANGVAYMLQGGLLLIVFAPVWWTFAQGWPYLMPAFQFANESAILFAALIQFGEVAILQLLVIGLCYSFAIRRAEALVE